MEIRDLRLVVTLADELHFRRAAERLHVGQPALSQHLRRLERRLGVRLFERSTHHVRLTPAGHAFVIEGREILGRLDAFEDTMAHHRQQQTLRVGSLDPIYDISVTVVAELGRRLDVRVTEVAVSGFAEAHRRLLDGDLDVYLGLPVPTDGVRSFALRSDRFGVFLAADHPLASQPSVSLRELADEPVMLDPDNQTPEFVTMVRGLFRTVGLEPRRSLSGSTSMLAAVHATARGGPVVVAPTVEPTPPGTTWIPISDAHAEDSWHLVWLADPPREAAIDAVDEVRRIACDEGWRISQR